MTAQQLIDYLLETFPTEKERKQIKIIVGENCDGAGFLDQDFIRINRDKTTQEVTHLEF